MGILDWLTPGGGKKADLSASISELAESARLESQRQNMPPRRALVWEALCGGASDILSQLLVSNREKALDWGLKGQRGKVTYPRLVALYWWMLLYQLVLFKNRGIDGYGPADEEFSEMSKAAREWVGSLASDSGQQIAAPEPWEPGWRSQVSLEAALGLYNRVTVMLEMRIDPDARVLRVSHFTTATVRAYDSTVQKSLAERLAGM